MFASEYGHTATVEVLLGAGAGTEAKNKVREIKCVNHTDRTTEVLFTFYFSLCPFDTYLLSFVLPCALPSASFSL